MEEKKVKVELSAQEFNTILAGLGELPHKIAVNVINTLVKQMQEQITPEGQVK